MKRPIYTIEERDANFHLELYDPSVNLLLTSKSFTTFKECQKFVDVLRLHMRFQTNYVRSKNDTGQYGFEIRTCWDELIAVSTWFATLEERADAMLTAYDCNEIAAFVHTNIYTESPLHLSKVA
jgi:hypothetical protein